MTPQSEATKARRRETWARRRAALWAPFLRRGKAPCRRCGHEKPLDAFPERVDGVGRHRRTPYKCRTCINLEKRVREKSARFRRKRRAKAAVAAMRLHARRTKARPEARAAAKAFERARPAWRKQRSWLAKAVHRGKVAKPGACPACRRNGKATGHRIAGYWPPGAPVTLETVAWYCYPCLWRVKHPAPPDEPDPELEAHWERQRLARRALASGRGLLRALAASPTEWRDAHAAHAAEVGPLDAEYDAARSGFRERFRSTVLSRATERAVRRAVEGGGPSSFFPTSPAYKGIGSKSYISGVVRVDSTVGAGRRRSAPSRPFLSSHRTTPVGVWRVGRSV